MARKRPDINEVLERLEKIEDAAKTYRPKDTLPATKTHARVKGRNPAPIVIAVALLLIIASIIAAQQYNLFNKEYDNPTSEFQIRDRIIEVTVPPPAEELLKEGDHFLTANKYDDAIDRFKKAYKQKQNDPTICWRIALAYDRKEERQKAIDWVKKAIALDLDNEYPYYRTALRDLEQN